MYSTYSEACEAVVSKEVAKREVLDHSCDWLLFLSEIGDKQEYTGQEVLDWLGY